jgi:hypothetical protein
MTYSQCYAADKNLENNSEMIYFIPTPSKNAYYKDILSALNMLLAFKNRTNM